MEIIGLVGRKQSGKSTVAQMFEDVGFRRYAFADPIREMLKTMFLWSDYNFSTEKTKEEIDPIWGVSPRQGMQSLGTEYGQYLLMQLYPEFKDKIGRGFWVKRFEILIGAHPEVDKWVIDDVRFPHEVESLNRLGAKLITVVREDGSDVVDDHESEAYYDDIATDYIVYNKGIDQLIKDIQFIQKDISNVK